MTAVLGAYHIGHLAALCMSGLYEPEVTESAMEHPDNNVYVSTLEMNVSSCRHQVLIKAYTWTHMTGEATLIASYLFGSMGEPYAIFPPLSPPHNVRDNCSNLHLTLQI